MFFEIVSPTGTKNFLLGTLHINDREIINLSLEIKNAFDKASRIVFESDVTNITIDLINDFSNEWMENNRTEEFPPMFEILQTILQTDPKRFENSLDNQLLIESQRKRKKIGFLETAEEQIKASIGYTFDEFEQAIYYEWLMANHRLDKENITASIENLKRYYLTSNLDALSQHEALSLDAPEIAYKYNKSIFSDRDIIQAEAMKIFMDEGNVFFAVGAKHLLGIINKLKTEGYLVTPILSGKTMYPITDNKHTLFNKTLLVKDKPQFSPVLRQTL